MSQYEYCETNSTQRRWFDVITQTSKLWTRRKIDDKQVSHLWEYILLNTQWQKFGPFYCLNWPEIVMEILS